MAISYNIEEIVDLANKDPIPGKITFVAKLIKMPGIEVSYEVENVRPKTHKEVLRVLQIRTFGKFALFEIETTSTHKQIAIHLVLNGKRLQSS